MRGLNPSIYISPHNKLTEYDLTNNILTIPESNDNIISTILTAS